MLHRNRRKCKSSNVVFPSRITLDKLVCVQVEMQHTEGIKGSIRNLRNMVRSCGSCSAPFIFSVIASRLMDIYVVDVQNQSSVCDYWNLINLNCSNDLLAFNFCNDYILNHKLNECNRELSTLRDYKQTYNLCLVYATIPKKICSHFLRARLIAK